MANLIDNVTNTNYGSYDGPTASSYRDKHSESSMPGSRYTPWADYTYNGYTNNSADGNQYINDFINNCINSVKDCSYYSLSSPEEYRNKCISAWETAALNNYKNLISPVVQDIQANADAASTAEASSINDAIQARKAGINAGMGKARAGLLGDATSNTNASNVYNNAYSASIQNQGSTQADYLQKMGQVAGLDCQAKNMQSGAALNTAGAALQGAGQGASLGASIGGK